MKKISGGALPRSHHRSAVIAVMVAAGMLAGCVVQPQPVQPFVVGTTAQPQAAFWTGPPSSRVAWEPGHWNWNGRQWVWISGRYVRRPNVRANVAMRWEQGHWARGNRGWVWVDGRWY